MAVFEVLDILRLELDPQLVPADGPLVCSPLAAPIKHPSKEPAGHLFHALVRRQSGLDGELASSQ